MSAKSGKVSIANELARDRNRAAADRTLMAWIRTALSLIAFGFSIGKLADYLKRANPNRVLDPIDSAQIFGEAFIVLGIASLIVAVIQNRRLLKRIEQGEYDYRAPFPLTLVTAILLLVIGFFGFVAVLL